MAEENAPSARRKWRAFVVIAVIAVVAAVTFFVLHNLASYHEAENQQAMENGSSPGHGNSELQ